MKHIIHIFLTHLFFICLLSCAPKIQKITQDTAMANPVDTTAYDDASTEENNEEMYEEEAPESTSSDFTYASFKIMFHDYLAGGGYEPETTDMDADDETKNIRLIKNDTLKLYEEIFYDLSDKLIQINPTDSSDRFRISYSFQENICEQFNYRKFESYSQEQREEAITTWGQNRVRWEGYPKYQTIKDSSDYFFRFPYIDYSQYEKNRKRVFHLRDTLVDLSGESYNVATLVYKDKACCYMLSHILLRIERFSHGKLTETKYIRIEMSYGC